MLCGTEIAADTTSDASFEMGYSSAFTAYVLRGSDDALQRALELGKKALAQRLGLSELLAVHNRRLASLIEAALGPAELHRRFARAQEFLTQVSTPFELAHHRWHEMAGRLGVANEELKTLVVKRTKAHGEAIERLEQAQQLALAARAELDHVTRLMTRGEMAAAIAHEINQPLTGIIAQANAAVRWLAGTPPDLDKTRKALERIIGTGHRASEVIGSIRAMFKREDNKKLPFDVNEAIKKTITLAQAELHEERVTVQFNLAHRLPPVLGDWVQMQQVIFNLLMNAIDAMRSVIHRPRVLMITSSLQGDNVSITVADSGIGIDSKIIDRVFDPFYTTKPRGMGIGLSICRSIIETHAGRIWASPSPNGGSVFHIVIPKAHDELAISRGARSA